MKTETKRGRPRKFDEDVTLDRIMLVFWRQGYAATSLDQIAEATGLNRPSLYAAFGSKKEMYLKVIGRFADQMQAHLHDAGLTASGLHPRLKAIMTAAIDLYCGKSSLCNAAYGCLAISTLTTEVADDPDFKSMMAHVVERMDQGFADLIREETKGLVPEANLRFTAQHLSLILHGISVRARTGESRTALQELAEAAVDRLVPETASQTVV
ncbi:TetR/AcrR family transcriptional regulator [Stappia sp. BW2]|uniref:TetR/AcrR family transcriptional regulator n=1 Tax=Stappia sp. BW2 TaxID=2592622 RepID=UPI0011DE691B|nr:TetR/AcrR family transcriptional regulator [Stappia sp. BW2]TYC65887.1 TetR/AcrR family transcriptional regulator [Stappia sp. BW2]